MILHIDMDAFYASVEQLDNPDLKGKCVIVSGRSRRGVVSAASYEARKFGIHSAMPIMNARKLCPEGIFIHPRMQRYKQVSQTIMTILRQFSPIVEPVSIDEAYLDHSGCHRLFGDVTHMGTAIKQTIQQEVGLTCSIGGAPYKFLAKIASDLDKPDGLTIISQEDAPAFIAALPIQKVPGVGKKTREILYGLNIHTLGQIQGYPEGILIRHLGKFGIRLKELASGMDQTKISASAERSSVSTEATLKNDTRNVERLISHLRVQSEEVGRQLRQMGLKAKTISLKIKHADFKQITRNRSISPPTHSSTRIFNEARNLLKAYQDDRKIRLIGVGASGLIKKNTPFQQSLFKEAERSDSHWERVDRVMDDIREKFGKGMVQRGGSRSGQPDNDA